MAVSRTAKLEAEDFRLNCLEERLREVQEEDLKHYNGLREEVGRLNQITSIQKLMDDQRQNREFMADTKLKELEGIDERLAGKLNQSIAVRSTHQNRVEGEERLIRFIDDKFTQLNTDLHKETAVRDRDVDAISRGVEENLTKIGEAVRIANIEREETDNDILKKIGEGLLLIAQRVSSERQNRESSEQAVYDLLKDVVARVKNEIDNEKREREKSEDSLISLLEDTCNKIQQLSQAY